MVDSNALTENIENGESGKHVEGWKMRARSDQTESTLGIMRRILTEDAVNGVLHVDPRQAKAACR